jgi:hypothetical protein
MTLGNQVILGILIPCRPSLAQTYRDVASGEGLVLGVLHPPVRGVLHDALAAGNGFTDGAAAHRLGVLRIDLRDAATILLLIRHV